MDDSADFLGPFVTIAVTAVFAYALSAAGRRWRQGFAQRPLPWLSSLNRRAIAGKWILYGIVFCWIALTYRMGFRRHPHPSLTIAVFGVIGGIANLLRELSSYATLEIEVRQRLATR